MTCTQTKRNRRTLQITLDNILISLPCVLWFFLRPLWTGSAATSLVKARRFEAHDFPCPTPPAQTVPYRASHAARSLSKHQLQGVIPWMQVTFSSHAQLINIVLFFLAFSLLVIGLFPLGVIDLAAGFLFGVLTGFPVALATKTSGSVLCFILSRYTCRSEDEKYWLACVHLCTYVRRRTFLGRCLDFLYLLRSETLMCL